MGEEGGYSIFDFIQSLSPLTLSFQSPSNEAHIWTFWSKEDDEGMLPSSSLETLTNNWQIKDGIKSVLRSITDWKYLYGPNFLVQFWAPTMTIGGQRLLTTMHQSFGLRRIERGLCEYRKHCMSLKFSTVIQDEEDDEFGGGGVIGRVFRHKQMESTPDIEYYSVEEYPQRDFALKCGVRRSLAVPVLDPSGQTCVGVLELVDRGKYEIFPIGLYTVAKRISQILEDSMERVVPLEIYQVLDVVCETHKLPLAQTWVPFRRTSATAYIDDCYLRCSSSSSLYRHGDDCDGDKLGKMLNLSRICEYHHVRKGWGLVGKAFLSRKCHFCRDVTKLPIAEYPLSDYVRIYGLTGCFAIFLQSTNGTGYHDCVLEFFLPPWNTISTDPRTFFKSLLATVNKHLHGLKISSGEGLGLGEELSDAVANYFSSINDEPDSFVTCQASRIQPIPESLQSEREAVQNKVTGYAVIANGSNVVGTEQNGVAPACLDNRVEMMHEERENEVGEELFVEVVKTAANVEITTILPRMPETLQIEREVVQLSDEDSSVEDVVVQNELNVMRNMCVTSLERICRVETLEKEYRTTETSLSREDLVKHFGKKLDDAADILGVSRSTMKRACRVHGIKKWPFPKRKKFKPPPSSLNHVNGFDQGGDEQVPKFGNSEPSYSDPPLMHAMSVVAHTISNITPKQDAGSVTVKATYGVEMIRFRLSFSSRKADLVEKMTQRFPLNDGTFNIKYEDDDGDWILIVCDEDLEECIAMSKSKSIIKMLVQPIDSQVP